MIQEQEGRGKRRKKGKEEKGSRQLRRVGGSKGGGEADIKEEGCCEGEDGRGQGWCQCRKG